MRKYMQNAYYKVVKVVAVTSIDIVITINNITFIRNST